MKKTLKILFISLTLVGCLSQNIELKPIQKVTECLFKELIAFYPNSKINTQVIDYNEKDNPLKWTVFDEKGQIEWQIILEYENNRLKKVTRFEYCDISQKIEINAVKLYEINDDFSEMIVSQMTIDSCVSKFEELLPQKLKFKRYASSQNELKLVELSTVEKNDNNKVVGSVTRYEYDSDNNNVLKISNDNLIIEQAKGFWKNIRDPFNTNIWLALISDYWAIWDVEGGHWSKNLQSIETGSNLLLAYEPNAQGFPCLLKAKELDFIEKPIELRFYYNNCECK